MEQVICIVGPTAVGKTELAVRLCRRCGGEVVSCDSMQIYRGMVIGTAAPEPEEMQGVVHHMIGIADPRENYSAARYVEQADACLQDILRRGKTAVITGGTGLYADSLIAGRSFAPYPQTGRREALEREAEEAGIACLLRRLKTVDPESAARLHPSDRRRIIRALEIYEETGRTMTEHDEETRRIPRKYNPVWIGLDFADRADLYDRINLRVDRMLQRGLVNEVRTLLASGVPENATAMQAIGYKEICAMLRGELTETEAAEQIKQASRRYAKRQRTWFRRNPDIHWIIHPKQPDLDWAEKTAAALCGI